MRHEGARTDEAAFIAGAVRDRARDPHPFRWVTDRDQPTGFRVTAAGRLEVDDVEPGFRTVRPEVVDEAQHAAAAEIEDQLRKQVFGMAAGPKNAELIHPG